MICHSNMYTNNTVSNNYRHHSFGTGVVQICFQDFESLTCRTWFESSNRTEDAIKCADPLTCPPGFTATKASLPMCKIGKLGKGYRDTCSWPRIGMEIVEWNSSCNQTTRSQCYCEYPIWGRCNHDRWQVEGQCCTWLRSTVWQLFQLHFCISAVLLWGPYCVNPKIKIEPEVLEQKMKRHSTIGHKSCCQNFSRTPRPNPEQECVARLLHTLVLLQSVNQ